MRVACIAGGICEGVIFDGGANICAAAVLSCYSFIIAAAVIVLWQGALFLLFVLLYSQRVANHLCETNYQSCYMTNILFSRWSPAREFTSGEAVSENRIHGFAAKTKALTGEIPSATQAITRATSTLSGIP